jgi:hypothetical protein
MLIGDLNGIINFLEINVILGEMMSRPRSDTNFDRISLHGCHSHSLSHSLTQSITHSNNQSINRSEL